MNLKLVKRKSENHTSRHVKVADKSDSNNYNSNSNISTHMITLINY